MLDDANVGALADAMFLAIALGLETSTHPNPRSLQMGVTDETTTGTSGTEHVQGRMSADGRGWYTATYVNYANGPATFNGMLVDEVLQVSPAGEWTSRRSSYHDLTISVAGRSATYAGQMTLTRDEQGGATASGTVRVRNGGVDLMASNLALTVRRIALVGIRPGFELTAGGRIFDATHGWVDLSFSAPWTISSSGEFPAYAGRIFGASSGWVDVDFGAPWTVSSSGGFPAYGGPILGTAGDGRALRVVSLTPTIVSLQYAAATPQRFDRAARVLWGTPFAAQTTRSPLSTPVADGGPSLSVLPGTKLTLEGGHSSHAETPFLRHRWALMFRPPGSIATLSHVDEVSPTITLDAPGRYLLELVVSDELRSSKRDFVAISADPRVSTDSQVFSSAQLPPSTVATVGTTVTLDTTRFTPNLLPLSSSVPPEVRVWGPHGDTLPTTQVGKALTFVPTEPGIYKAVLGTALTVARGYDTQYFSVLTEAYFKPSVWIPTAGRADGIVAADIDGDGRADAIVSEESRIEIFFGGALPDMYGPVALPTGTFFGQRVAVGDLTGDGRADIAAPVFDGLAVFVQRPDGRSFEPTLIPGSCASPSARVVIADVNGDARSDVAMTCYLRLVYYLGRADGTLDAERSVSGTHDSDSDLVAGDLNDDGFDDLAVTKQHAPNVGIAYGQAGTSPLAIQWLTLVNQSHDRIPHVAVADINADGRTDLVFGGRAFGSNNLESDKLRTFLQNGSGELTAAQVIDLPVRRGLIGVSVGDFNHDGKVDIGVENGTLAFAAHYQIAPGVFEAETRAAFDCTNKASGDFNGDGLADVACGTGSSQQPALGILFGTRPD